MKAPVDLKNLTAYGDTTGDGFVQFSFCLPVLPSPKTKEAARRLIEQWGFEDVKVVHVAAAGESYSFVVAYGRMTRGIDYTQIKVKSLPQDTRDYKEIDAQILKQIGRPIRVVGACTGFDAHTVGLDAILNMKGYDGDVGLERYKGFTVFNLGSQVPPEVLIDRAIKEKADAILVSKIVTQKDIHLSDLQDVQAVIEKRNLQDKFILVAGGPRLSHQLALELGYDAGFSVGTRPVDVAGFILDKMLAKQKKKK